MIKPFLICAAVSFCVVGNTVLAQESQLSTYGHTHEIRVVSDKKLSPNQQLEYDAFLDFDLSYFGAFYISRTHDEAIFDYGANGLEAVKKFVKLLCEFDTEGVEKSCEPYALVLPTGVVPDAPNLKGISQLNFREVYQTFDAAQVKGRYGAIAVSPLYSAAWVADYRYRTDAHTNALGEC